LSEAWAVNLEFDVESCLCSLLAGGERKVHHSYLTVPCCLLLRRWTRLSCLRHAFGVFRSFLFCECVVSHPIPLDIDTVHWRRTLQTPTNRHTHRTFRT
jgi:hypothetical protein